MTTGINQRIPATLSVCKALKDSVLTKSAKEAIILAGDFNDDYHPLRILNEEMGFIDVFESLDLVSPSTHPVRPSDFQEEMRPNRYIPFSNFPFCLLLFLFFNLLHSPSSSSSSSSLSLTTITRCLHALPSTTAYTGR